MLEGKFIDSLYYNSSVIYTTIITSIYLITQTISRITKKEKLAIKYSPIFLYSGIGLLIINCILKNVFLFIL